MRLGRRWRVAGWCGQAAPLLEAIDASFDRVALLYASASKAGGRYGSGALHLCDVITGWPLGNNRSTPGGTIRFLAFTQDDDSLYVSGEHIFVQTYVVALDRAVARL